MFEIYKQIKTERNFLLVTAFFFVVGIGCLITSYTTYKEAQTTSSTPQILTAQQLSTQGYNNKYIKLTNYYPDVNAAAIQKDKNSNFIRRRFVPLIPQKSPRKYTPNIYLCTTYLQTKSNIKNFRKETTLVGYISDIDIDTFPIPIDSSPLHDRYPHACLTDSIIINHNATPPTTTRAILSFIGATIFLALGIICAFCYISHLKSNP